MENNEQIIKKLFNEVKQELDHQMKDIKTEITDKYMVLVPTGSEEEIKEFVESQKLHYEEYFSDEFGKPKVMPFTWERYHKFVSESFNIKESREEEKLC